MSKLDEAKRLFDADLDKATKEVLKRWEKMCKDTKVVTALKGLRNGRNR